MEMYNRFLMAFVSGVTDPSRPLGRGLRTRSPAELYPKHYGYS